jgi:hypothetical protein
MKKRVHASNTLIPAILALEQAGFAVNVSYSKDGPNYWAVRGEETYEGDSPESILGMLKLVELRGRDWQAKDEEITKTSDRHRLLPKSRGVASSRIAGAAREDGQNTES